MDQRERNRTAEASNGTSRNYSLVFGWSSFLFALFLAYTLQLFWFSPISPDPLYFPSSVSLPTNHILEQRVSKVGEGLLDRPEGLCVDEKGGIVYAATRDGWIKRLHSNGTLEDWKMVGGNSLLGIATSAGGHILACEPNKGLLKVDEDGATVLASHVDGYEIRFADDVIEASDGSIYFSDGSSKFDFHNWPLDLMEAKPYGRLLKYDPSTNETSIVLRDLYFANGVALSRDRDYLVISETWKFRCLKYWLEGDKKGQTEILVENLPGGPDNINLAPDGSFWIALLQLAPRGLEFVHASKTLKRLIAASPTLMNYFSGIRGGASVVNVAADGTIRRKFDDPNGKILSFVTSALEFENHLYLGSLTANFIGKLKLEDL